MGGVGITNGLAVPDFRLLAGVRYAVGLPGKGGERDSDSDGIADRDDRCPSEAGGLRWLRGQRRLPGAGQRPRRHPRRRRRMPRRPEEPGGDRDGCPDKARVTVRNGKLVIFGKIQFASGSDDILPKSEQLVDEMARALKEHPELKKVEIQGHTDSSGDEFFNLKLGQERAESVKHALVKRGVAPDRLVPKGYGECNPIAPNITRGRSRQESPRRVRDRELTPRRPAMRRTFCRNRVDAGALSGASARGQTFPATFAPLYCQRGVMIDGYRDQSGADR